MYTKTYTEICRAIDWTELSKQKQTLLRLKESTPKGKDRKNIENHLKLIDALQDSAIFVNGVPESKVFPSLDIVRLTSKQLQLN